MSMRRRFGKPSGRPLFSYAGTTGTRLTLGVGASGAPFASSIFALQPQAARMGYERVLRLEVLQKGWQDHQAFARHGDR